MINIEALLNISYGLYIVCSGDQNNGNGFISNTFFQVTSEPAKFAVCCNKNNLTAEYIKKYGAFSVSVLEQNAPLETIRHFGFKSGNDVDKMAGTTVKYGETGVPIVLNDSLAFLEFKVVDTIDVGTHLMFIGELVSAEVMDGTKQPLTYLYYRLVKKGVSPKNAPTYIDQSKLESKPKNTLAKKFKCLACGYVYDEAIEIIAFDELPNDWVCPLCGSAKTSFIEI